jgi:hypothetical protein
VSRGCRATWEIVQMVESPREAEAGFPEARPPVNLELGAVPDRADDHWIGVILATRRGSSARYHVTMCVFELLAPAATTAAAAQLI